MPHVVSVSLVAGLSPRVRGNLSSRGQPVDRRRSIPACAGEPSLLVCCQKGRYVYPRVCGGTHHDVANGDILHGLSPRVRGNPRPSLHVRRGPRSIPACAGEHLSNTYAPAISWVYPRVCGGTSNEDTHDEGRLPAKTPMSEQALGNTPPIDRVKPQYRPPQASLDTGPVDYFSFCKPVRTRG